MRPGTQKFLFGALALSLLLFSLAYHIASGHRAISNDGIGYYSFLPAVFISQDTSFQSTVHVYEELLGQHPQPLQECPEGNPICNEFVGLTQRADGTYYDKYPVGAAVLQAPFFLIADNYVKLSGGIRDGVSEPYQLAIAVAGVVYFTLGLYFAYQVLSSRFSKKTTLLSLGILVFGTNILHYTIYEPSMSHVYSFSLTTLAVYLTDKYLKQNSPKTLLLLLADLLLIALVRNFNLLFSLIPILIIIKSTPQKLRFKELVRIMLFWLPIALVIFIPQLLYWKISTGQFLVFGYGNEYFNLLQPHLAEILFGLESNGLFFWHPLLLLAIPGAFYWVKSKDPFSKISIIFLAVLVYVLSCWWAYYFGYSFGHRAFTDFYILFAIPIACLVERVLKLKKVYIYVIFTLISLFIALNLVQMNNYWRGVVASYNLTTENYWQNFAKPYINFEKR